MSSRQLETAALWLMDFFKWFLFAFHPEMPFKSLSYFGRGLLPLA